jgi:magnesium-transporting ATPase (P-type)
MSTASLPFVQLQIALYGASILLALGNIGNIVNVLVFGRNRRNPCSMYLTAAAIMNIITLSFNAAQYIYNAKYGDPTGHSIVYCKIRFCLANILGQMSRCFICFACIDRYAMTSANPRVRALSRPSVALWCLGIGTVIWFIIRELQNDFFSVPVPVWSR